MGVRPHTTSQHSSQKAKGKSKDKIILCKKISHPYGQLIYIILVNESENYKFNMLYGRLSFSELK
ncbi:hypothetical protein V7S50_33940, partial [Bacillus sp. CCNWLW194]